MQNMVETREANNERIAAEVMSGGTGAFTKPEYVETDKCVTIKKYKDLI